MVRYPYLFIYFSNSCSLSPFLLSFLLSFKISIIHNGVQYVFVIKVYEIYKFRHCVLIFVESYDILSYRN